jgi:F420-0:gamma-glutamyl ligase
MEKDKGAIIVGKPDQLIPTIETVIASVNAGLDRSQLDRQLTLHEPINR